MEFSSFQIGVWSFEAKVWSLWFIEVIKSELVLFQAVSFTVLTHNTCYNLIIIKSSFQIFVTSNAVRYLMDLSYLNFWGAEGEDNYHLLGIIYEGLNREILSQWYEKIIRPSDSNDYLDRGKSTILRVRQFEVAEPLRDGLSGNRNY